MYLMTQISRSQYQEDIEIELEVHYEVIDGLYECKIEKNNKVIKEPCKEVCMIEHHEHTNKITV